MRFGARLNPARWRTRKARVRRFALSLTVALAAAVPSAGQVPADWASDVRALVAAMDSIHPAPYRIHSREQWAGEAAALEVRVPTLRYHEFVAELGRLIALAGDGHTRLGQIRLQDHQRVLLDPGKGGAFETRYPVRFEVFADGLYVVQTSEPLAHLLGRKVGAINGIATREVFERLRPYLAADNEAWRLYLLPGYLSSPAIVAGTGLSGSPSDPLSLTLASPTAPTEVRLEPVDSVASWLDADRHLNPTGPRPLYRSMEDSYGFRYLDTSRTVYVRYREVRDAEGESLAAFADRLFRFVDSAEVDRLVLDVRRNGGGNNYLNQPLVHGLIRATKVNQPGRLFVITDRGTFSAAISFVGDVEANTHALFVGEPTGSPVNQYGDSRRVSLPASGVEVRISTLYWQKSDPRDPRPWVAPDLPAPIRFADWLAGRDPALEAIFAYRHDPSERGLAPNTNWQRPSQRVEYPPLVAW